MAEDLISISPRPILVGDLAKRLSDRGADIDRKRLFNWLRQEGYLYSRQGPNFNMPTQAAVDLDLFEVEEFTSVKPDGHVRISKKVRVLDSGQRYFAAKFLQPPDEKRLSRRTIFEFSPADTGDHVLRPARRED